jgi:hypothetical protein
VFPVSEILSQPRHLGAGVVGEVLAYLTEPLNKLERPTCIGIFIFAILVIFSILRSPREMNTVDINLLMHRLSQLIGLRFK